MLSLRTALSRSQPLNPLTRHSPRVPHLAHGKSSHNPPTPIMGRAFSIAPKLLKPEEDKLDMVLNCTRAEYMTLVATLKKQRLRDDCEDFRYWGDRNLREKLKACYVDDEDKKWEVDVNDDQLVLSKGFELFEIGYREREMKKAGKEYDAQLARVKGKSCSTESAVDNAEDGDCDCPYCLDED
ncbi:hypothetical protein BDR22DRAFT_873411 [Usnea florida]